jgi:hypothetical protein
MEQSRLVYEDATHQLGYFLELVSKQLTVLNHRPDNTLDTSSTTEHASCRTNASTRNSSVNVTSQEFKPCAESMAHIATSFIKSSHSRNDKSFTRKRGRQKKEIQCYPSRTRSAHLHVNNDEEANPNEKKWSSDSNIQRLEQDEVFERKSKFKNLFKNIKTYMRKEKRTGKFSVTKSTEQHELKITESMSTSIIGFHGIWSLRYY